MHDELRQHWVSQAQAARDAISVATRVQNILCDRDVENAAFRAVLAVHNMLAAEIELRDYQALNQRLTHAAARSMANAAAPSTAVPLSNSAWAVLLKEPKWAKLSLASSRREICLL